MRGAVVGGGSWGTSLAAILGRGDRSVALWIRDESLADDVARTRHNHRYVENLRLNEDIEVSSRLEECLRDADIVIFAVPTHGMRNVAECAAPHLTSQATVVSAAKGFEESTGSTMTAVLTETLPGRPVAALSGPNIASELAAGLPAATVVSSVDVSVAETVRDALTGSQLRVYSNPDVVGVEYGGALKNVVAIAAGMGDGLRAGDNAKAALITRGLTEMGRLGVAAGASPITFAGLTGLGDCVVTCMSPHSRNRSLGEALGRGATLAEALAGRHTVAEGVGATRAGKRLAEHSGVDMPLLNGVHAVLFDGRGIQEVAGQLMARGPRDELDELNLGGSHF